MTVPIIVFWPPPASRFLPELVETFLWVRSNSGTTCKVTWLLPRGQTQVIEPEVRVPISSEGKVWVGRTHTVYRGGCYQYTCETQYDNSSFCTDPSTGLRYLQYAFEMTSRPGWLSVSAGLPSECFVKLFSRLIASTLCLASFDGCVVESRRDCSLSNPSDTAAQPDVHGNIRSLLITVHNVLLGKLYSGNCQPEKSAAFTCVAVAVAPEDRWTATIFSRRSLHGDGQDVL